MKSEFIFLFDTFEKENYFKKNGINLSTYRSEQETKKKSSNAWARKSLIEHHFLNDGWNVKISGLNFTLEGKFCLTRDGLMYIWASFKGFCCQIQHKLRNKDSVMFYRAHKIHQHFERVVDMNMIINLNKISSLLNFWAEKSFDMIIEYLRVKNSSFFNI